MKSGIRARSALFVFPHPLVVGFLWLALMAFAPASACRADDSTLLTLWPLVDYRSAPQDEFTSLGVAGPFLRYEHTEKRTRFGLRPLYYREANDDGLSSEGEILYPVATFRADDEGSSLQFLHLLSFDNSKEKGDDAMLFPFLFYHDPPQGEGYFAFFPLGGKILDRFGRDRIEFALFPLYSRTERKGTATTNILWPIFSLTKGENERGWAFWPLYGTTEKLNVYRRTFCLWPIFFSADERLDTSDPLRTRAIFPFFYFADSQTRTDHSYLWPFFSHVEDYRNDFEGWDFPWPIFRVIDGKDRQMLRLLPFYSDDRTATTRSRWLLWPFFKDEEKTTATYSSRRQRILYFLYSGSSETFAGDEAPAIRRTDLWPFFTFEKKDGVSRFSTLSLMEPFFPGNVQIERSWSPLWRIYQRRWDDAGNEASTFLWNLYWSERRGDARIFEVFPLFFYRNEGGGRPFEVTFLKGLYRYRQEDGQVCSYLLYLPWGICHAETATKVQNKTPVKESH